MLNTYHPARFPAGNRETCKTRPTVCLGLRDRSERHEARRHRTGGGKREEGRGKCKAGAALPTQSLAPTSLAVLFPLPSSLFPLPSLFCLTSYHFNVALKKSVPPRIPRFRRA